MRAELLNNTLFLKYYNQWCKDPKSVVFASLAEFFLLYDMLEEAVKVCKEGLKYNPNSVLGRLVLSKVLIKKGDFDNADENLRHILEIMPSNSSARELKIILEMAKKGEGTVNISASTIQDDKELEKDTLHEKTVNEESPYLDVEDANFSNDETSLPAWQTVTMAKIYSSQGHIGRARKIYESILSRDPSNEVARNELKSLAGGD